LKKNTKNTIKQLKKLQEHQLRLWNLKLFTAINWKESKNLELSEQQGPYILLKIHAVVCQTSIF